MKTDFTYCLGMHCPNKTHCVRYVNGLEAANEKDKLYSWIQNCRHGKLYISTEREDETNVSYIK